MAKLILSWLFVVLFGLTITFHDVCAFPEKGKWTYEINEETKFIGVSKSLFAKSAISFNIKNCKSEEAIQLKVSWILRRSPCWQEFIGLENTETEEGNLQNHFHGSPNSVKIKEGLNYANSDADYIRSKESTFSCDGSDVNPIVMPEIVSPSEKIRLDRSPVADSPQFVVPKEGVYLLIIQIKGSSIPFTAQTTIEMKSDHGYLSAVDWPLLSFYATMCALYSTMGIIWLIICLWKWRDILRIQMWIGAVLFLGMLEMSVYFAEYESLNNAGELTIAAEYTAELLSCAKRSLARILVLIASMGFGIVKSRLGTMLRKIVKAGIVYMVISAIESYLKLVQPKNNASINIYAASLILAVMDAALCFWIFSSLVATIRAVGTKKNTEKMKLYKLFSGTLVFAVLASLIFMFWSIYFYQMNFCLTDWKELWLDEAFWKSLFSIILIVIMLLWRPTNNNQRYAFTPLLDNGEEEDEESSPSKTFGSSPLEDDLKWVEEHIPSSGVESGAPVFDSDEEIVKTHVQSSKIQ